MDEYSPETELAMFKDTNVLDGALKSVWDKVRLATQLITQLREEKSNLSGHVDELERQVSSLRSEILAKGQELKRLQTEHIQLLNANGHRSFGEEEKENLKVKIRDLISKINSYL